MQPSQAQPGIFTPVLPGEKLTLKLSAVPIVNPVAILFLLLGISPLHQRDSQPEKSVGFRSSCMYDSERGEVPDCILRNPNGHLYIAPTVLYELHFDRHGLAAVHSQSENWMYVNRHGDVVVSSVPTFDNGADTFHDGLVRLVKNGKYGFANRKGRVVIEAIFDGAMNFEGGYAKVCRGCVLKPSGADSEHSSFVGGLWVLIDKKGDPVVSSPEIK